VKIAFTNDIIHAYATGSSLAVGGAERYQWLLARALVRHGISVTVGVREVDQNRLPCLLDGVRFVSLSRGHALKAWHHFLSSEKPDWWYWQCADHLWGPAVEIAKRLGIKTVFSAAVDRDVILRKALYRRPYCWPLYAWGLFRNDRILVQHEWQLLHLPAALRSKASILPGIVETRAKVTAHRTREKYVAWVAMLREVKRPDLLIEIARSLPEIRFVVSGGPTAYFARPGYGEHIVNTLRTLPNIDYRGRVAPRQAIDIIGNAGLLLSTSDEEGFPSTFLEAWSAGTPVLSLQLDPGSIIERFHLGVVSKTVQAAIEDISSLMNSAEYRDEIAQRARDYISTNHSELSAVKALRQAVSN
jgi:glycosyltransferase involved in cell wall biosynthesis